jgi:hypothetical protein
MRVELLYADGDPAAMRARQNLVEVLTEDAFETPIREDIDPAWDGPIGLAARRYGDDGIPPKSLIRRAVDRARGWSHGRR